MSAEADIRGLKRICTACSARFYDMNKRPIVCPSCGEEFTGEVKIRTRKAKSAIVKDEVGNAIKAKAMEETSDDELEEASDDESLVISLDDDALKPEAGSDDEEDDVPAPDLNLDAGIGDLDDVDVDEDADDIDPDAVIDEDSDDEEEKA